MTAFDVRDGDIGGRILMASYAVRGRSATAGSKPDAISPEVTVISPAAGTTIEPDDTLIVEVTDNEEIALAPLYAEFPNQNAAEMVYNGTALLAPYAASSSIVNLANGGKRFSLKRTGGWPDDVSLTFIPTDTSGNVA
jgi:NhaP-type Na+/H+ and K+/H+ antiporter